MGSRSSANLSRRVRRAYELGRLRVASRVLWLVGVVMAVAAWSREPRPAVALGGLLALVGVGLRWWGGAAGRAVVPGLLGGTLVMLVLRLVQGCGVACETNPAYSLVCAGAGLVAGAVLLRTLRGEHKELAPSAVWAASIAGVTAALGCASFGLGASLGIAAAVVIGGIGVTVLATR